MTQQKAILNHLRNHEDGITSKEAIDRYGCTRLSAVIAALENKGYVIEHVRETVNSRYGKVSVSRYRLGV